MGAKEWGLHPQEQRLGPTESGAGWGTPRAPHLDGHGQQLPVGFHLQQDKRGGHVLLLTPDHVGWNSIQQDEVGLKQGTVLGRGGRCPWFEWKSHLQGQDQGGHVDVASGRHPVSVPVSCWRDWSI